MTKDKIKILNLCCTTCPSECELRVNVQGDKVLNVEGNICKRGVRFAQKEITRPERTLTTTIRIKINGRSSLLPVKTSGPIPKEDMMLAMKKVREVEINQPYEMGDVLIKNICDTGVDVMACRSFKEDNHAC